MNLKLVNKYYEIEGIRNYSMNIKLSNDYRIIEKILGY